MEILKKDLKHKPRKEQEIALDFIKKEFEEKGDILKYILLDLPTGIGKSYLNMMFIDWYLKEINPKANFDILTNSKILQEQYTKDFDSISNLWGKKNYKCFDYDTDCEDGKGFNKINKTKCLNCPYDRHKNSYLKSKINLTNFHLFTLLNFYNKDIIEQRTSDVLIIDEGHDFEEVVCSFLAINFSERRLKALSFTNYKSIGKTIKSINDVGDFMEFSEKFRDECLDTMGKLKSLISHNKKDTKNLQKFSDVESLFNRVENFIKDYAIRSDNWILESSYNDKKEKSISIQPVWASPYLDEHIWSKYEHVLMLSGTFLKKDLTCFLNGIPKERACYLNMDSPFDVKNRPIWYIPVSKMTYKNKGDAFLQYEPFIKKFMSKYKNKKGILHTVTYEIAEWVKETFPSEDRFIFHDNSDKDKALKRHYNTDYPTVLVSPSMNTGVNLEYDRARFQILLKVPYPNLGSNRTKRRMEMNEEYYTYRTVLGIIQAYGRGVRSYDDTCDFIIIDQSFDNVLRYSYSWLPEYFTKALKRVDTNKLRKTM